MELIFESTSRELWNIFTVHVNQQINHQTRKTAKISYKLFQGQIIFSVHRNNLLQVIGSLARIYFNPVVATEGICNE